MSSFHVLSRNVASIIAAVLVATVLVACGGGADQQPGRDRVPSVSIQSSATSAKANTGGEACRSAYEESVSAIQKAAIGQGLSQKLSTKAVNAWRMYRYGKVKPATNQIEVALQLLRTPATKQVGQATRDGISAALVRFKSCVATGSPPPTATLTVHVVYPDLNTSAGAGILVEVEGVALGFTDDQGNVGGSVPSGMIQVTATLQSFAIGTSTLNAAPGTAVQTTVLLNDNKEVASLRDLLLDEASDGLLPSTFATFSLRFMSPDGSTTIPITLLSEIELVDDKLTVPVFLENYFSVASDGALVATNISGLRSALLGRTGAITLRVLGQDGKGFSYTNTITFYIGKYAVKARLVAPPSASMLPLNGIPIVANMLGTNLTINALADADGVFQLPPLPGGNLSLSGVASQNGKYYYADGLVVVASDLNIGVVLRSVGDIVAGVPAITQLAAQAALSAEANPVEGSNLRGFAAADGIGAHSPMTITQQQELAAATVLGSIVATAGSINAEISKTATVQIPAGTKTITLSYVVATTEYPVYVLAQSIFNDVWSLAVFGGTSGQQLFSITRNVNSQLSVPPTWQSNGTTGTITQVIDVSALTATQSTTLTLHATAKNVGDGVLPTSVSASLQSDTPVEITAVVPDTVPTTQGDSSYYSIPRPGATNIKLRTFDLKVSKPAGATLDRVKVELRQGSQTLMTMLDSAVGSPGIEIIDPTTLRVRVTAKDSASTVSSEPPPTHDIAYRFSVASTVNGGQGSSQKDSGPRRALWRMPNGFARYDVPPADGSGNDWCAKATYDWMSTNRTLLTRIGDVSGEHARDLGHPKGHRTGVDIDMYHFYTFPNGNGSGGMNFVLLRNNVFAALSGDAAAKDRVKSWITASKQGLNNLLALGSVRILFYSSGAGASRTLPVKDGDGNTVQASVALTTGWAEGLLKTGKIAATAALPSGPITLELDTETGSWSPNKDRMRFNTVHDSHIHVGLQN